jgi:hypothetical protein
VRPGAGVSVQTRLARLQSRVHRLLESETEKCIGEVPPEIEKYAREYRGDFARLPRRPNPISRVEMIREIRRADVTFIGDYHTFAQSQRTACRIIREAVRPGETWWIGLEMIPSIYQPELDLFSRGKLSAARLRQRIRFEQEWSFPWENYVPILEVALARGARLIALNRPREALRELGNDLHGRDRWAAGIITDLFASQVAAQRAAQSGRARMITIYGELHVGRKHLPRQLTALSRAFLEKPLHSLSIHQNDARLHSKLTAAGREHQTDIVRLNRDVFCVLNAPPWAKLRSLINWLEATPQETDGETHHDHLGSMRDYGRALAELLDLPEPSFDALEVSTNVDPSRAVVRLRKLPLAERALARTLIRSRQRCYLPRAGIAHLGSPSENGTVELAARHLLGETTGTDLLFEPGADAYYRLVLDAAFVSFGALALNSRRKCDLPADHEARISALENGARPEFPQEIEARRLALATLKGDEAPFLARAEKSARLAPAVFLGARYVGQILASALHRVSLPRPLPEVRARIRDLFFDHPSAGARGRRAYFSRARVAYALLRETVAEVKLPPSKSERL